MGVVFGFGFGTPPEGSIDESLTSKSGARLSVDESLSGFRVRKACDSLKESSIRRLRSPLFESSSRESSSSRKMLRVASVFALVGAASALQVTQPIVTAGNALLR